MTSKRNVIEGIQEQGADENIAWQMIVHADTGVPASVTSVTVYLQDPETKTYTDTTATNMPAGVASIVGQTITLPHLTALVIGGLYKIECRFVVGANTLEGYFWVNCTK